MVEPTRHTTAHTSATGVITGAVTFVDVARVVGGAAFIVSLVQICNRVVTATAGLGQSWGGGEVAVSVSRIPHQTLTRGGLCSGTFGHTFQGRVGGNVRKDVTTVQMHSSLALIVGHTRSGGRHTLDSSAGVILDLAQVESRCSFDIHGQIVFAAEATASQGHLHASEEGQADARPVTPALDPVHIFHASLEM